MTDPTPDNPTGTETGDSPSAAEAMHETRAGLADRRASGMDGGSSTPSDSQAAGEPAAGLASTPQAARFAGFALGITGLVLTLVMVWLALGASSSSTVDLLTTMSGAARPSQPQGVSAAAPRAAACGAPVTVAASSTDGRLPLMSDVTGLMEADIETFVVIGKAAAASGHPRDAESAFLMSCRVAEQLMGAESVDSARAKHQLGEFYAQLAIAGGAGVEGAREEMISRASHLYAQSLRLFVAHADQAGKRPQQVVEAPRPSPPTAPDGRATRDSGLATLATPSEASAPPYAPQPERAIALQAGDAVAANASAKRAKQRPATQSTAALRAKSRHARVKLSGQPGRIDHPARAERTLTGASAGAASDLTAELYRGR